MTYSPSAIKGLFAAVKRVHASAVNSGIAADKSGYHNSYNRNRSRWPGDYSTLHWRDKLGDLDAARGLDITGPQSLLQIMCRRLVDASAARDSRLVGILREFGGSLDGRTVTARRIDDNARISMDDSHEWHLHLSIFTQFATNAQACLGIAEVLLGLPKGSLTGVPFAWDGKSFPGAEQFYLGVNGPWITWLGQRLVAHGWKGYEEGPGPAFTEVDLAGVKWAQAQQGFTGADADGIPGAQTWAWLASTPKPPVVVVPPVVKPPVVVPPKPTTPKPTTPKPEVPAMTIYEIVVLFTNVLRRTDPDKTRKRWPARVANLIKHIKSVNPDVVLANELDVVTALAIATLLGPKWRYQRLKGIGIFWNSEVFEFSEGSVLERLFSTKDNRYVFVVKVKHRASGRLVNLVTSHLENDGDKATNGAAVRKVQSLEIAKLIGSGLWIFGADLNSTTPTNGARAAVPSSKPRVILGKLLTFLTDQKGVANRQYASHHGGKGATPLGAWIDDLAWKGFTFVKGGLVRTDATDASDHHMPWAVLRFTK